MGPDGKGRTWSRRDDVGDYAVRAETPGDGVQAFGRAHSVPAEPGDVKLYIAGGDPCLDRLLVVRAQAELRGAPPGEWRD